MNQTILAYQPQINVFYPQSPQQNNNETIKNIDQNKNKIKYKALNDKIQYNRLNEDDDNFKKEIEIRFQQSKINRDYEYPRKAQIDNNNSTSLSDASFDSIRNVGSYNLNKMKNHESSDKKKKLRTKTNDINNQKRASFNQLLNSSPFQNGGDNYNHGQRIKTEGPQFDEVITVQSLKLANKAQQIQKTKFGNRINTIDMDKISKAVLGRGLKLNKESLSSQSSKFSDGITPKQSKFKQSNSNIQHAYGFPYQINTGSDLKSEINSNLSKAQQYGNINLINSAKTNTSKNESNQSPLIKKQLSKNQSKQLNFKLFSGGSQSISNNLINNNIKKKTNNTNNNDIDSKVNNINNNNNNYNNNNNNNNNNNINNNNHGIGSFTDRRNFNNIQQSLITNNRGQGKPFVKITQPNSRLQTQNNEQASPQMINSSVKELLKQFQNKKFDLKKNDSQNKYSQSSMNKLQDQKQSLAIQLVNQIQNQLKQQASQRKIFNQNIPNNQKLPRGTSFKHQRNQTECNQIKSSRMVTEQDEDVIQQNNKFKSQDSAQKRGKSNLIRQ